MLFARFNQKIIYSFVGFIDGVFDVSEDSKPKTEKSFAEENESVLNSKSKEETMVNA